MNDGVAETARPDGLDDHVTRMLLASFDTWLAAIASLIVVPLTFMTLYLRSTRDHQVTRLAELAARVDRLEAALDRLTNTVTQAERDLTTKEEWLREAMHTRHRLDRVIEAVVRVESTLYGSPETPPRRADQGGAP